MSSEKTSVPKPVDIPANPDLTASGDYRGRFGYGRPAHGSDPGAQYKFAEQPAADKAGVVGPTEATENENGGE